VVTSRSSTIRGLVSARNPPARLESGGFAAKVTA